MIVVFSTKGEAPPLSFDPRNEYIPFTAGIYWWLVKCIKAVSTRNEFYLILGVFAKECRLSVSTDAGDELGVRKWEKHVSPEHQIGE